MARPPDPELRRKLRERAIDYVLQNGLADLSLRPLAKALGTSARMLVYHFGSRERLLHEVLAGIREREAARIDAWWSEGPAPRTLAGFIRWYWGSLGAPGSEPAIRLLFELYALALRDPKAFPGVLENPLAYWQALARRARDRANAATATLALAAVRGLLLDLAATGDRRRVQAALGLLCELVDRRDQSS
jgi:AcrR family transcriptional regulator